MAFGEIDPTHISTESFGRTGHAYMGLALVEINCGEWLPIRQAVEAPWRSKLLASRILRHVGCGRFSFLYQRRALTSQYHKEGAIRPIAGLILNRCAVTNDKLLAEFLKKQVTTEYRNTDVRLISAKDNATSPRPSRPPMLRHSAQLKEWSIRTTY